ncbi:hypothetical protein ABLN67_15935 [Mycobacterium tuberculosis]
MFNRFIYRREWSFRIYRETLSRFSCAASPTESQRGQLGQLARLTTTTAPIAYYSPDPTLVLGGSWEKSCLLRPAGPHHGNRPRRTGGKPWPTE